MKKTLIRLFLVALTLFIGTNYVMAAGAPSSITLGSQSMTTSYITGGQTRGVYYRVSSDGKIMYCMTYERTSPYSGMSFTLGSELDAGMSYLLANGYPNKSFTGDKYKDYYITQVAIWLYQSDYGHGMSKVVTSVKNGGYANNYYANQSRDLYNRAVKARNAGYAKSTFSLDTKNITLTLKDNYFVSDLIKASGTNTSETYNLTLNNAPSGTTITNKSGSTTNTININDGFYVKVPASSVNGKNISFTISAQTNGVVNKAYLYKSGNSYQDMSEAVLHPIYTPLKDTLTIDVSSNVVKISKQDITTKEELPGAKLTLKDSKGNIVEEWISTSSSHYIYNLKDGEYTLSETTAPEGYKLSTETITFTVVNGKVNENIIMYNERKPEETPPKEEVIPKEEIEIIEVKKTDSSATLFYIVCSLVTISGIGIIYKYRHARK